MYKFVLLFAALSLNVNADIARPLQSDRLGQVAEAVGITLSDNNIAGGTTWLWAGRLKPANSDMEFETLVRKGFAEAFKYDREEDTPPATLEVIKIGKFVDGDRRNGDVYSMTTALIESNDYNNGKEVRDSSARSLWAVLRQLPVSNKTLIGHVKARFMHSSSESERTVQYFLLLNEDKKLVQFFTVEGSM